MGLTLKSSPHPLKKDANGVIRVGDTRIPFETVVIAFKNGATSEEIVYQFPVLELSDVYAVVSYYLKNQVVVDKWLEQIQRESAELRQKVQARFPTSGIRERLLKRKTSG